MQTDADPRPISVFRHLALAAVLACGAATAGCDGQRMRRGRSPDRTHDYVANSAGLISLTEGPANWLVMAEGLYARLTDALEVPPATLEASAGECELWVHPDPVLCDPGCFTGACVGDRYCAPFPLPVSAGEITVTGLHEPVRFMPGPAGYYADAETSPGQLFADDPTIVASAPGDEVPGFTLEVSGVVPLEADLELVDGTLRIQDGLDEVIRWRAEGSGRIQLGLAIGHHGHPYEGLIVCETEDDGDLVVPGELITLFPRQSDGGLGQHPSWLARFDRDVIETDAGPVELLVSSTVVIDSLAHF
jgi:hypothetical protein